MSKIWYSCKVKYGKENEEGILRQVTEAYLVDAMSYTEAESRIYEEMEKEVNGEFQVTTITKTNISEIIGEQDEEHWYKSKVTYSTVDGDSEKEVNINTYYLVNAANLKNAYEQIDANLHSMLVPYEIPSIAKTSFLAVYAYQGEDRESANLEGRNLTPIADLAED
ncbi:MAG: DUF4494 domain-containing protein [Cyclobacteriaceae bacterium]|nr:DUF4494 domain-containing protein [Cyclobacteriaceae bacterium HetDA_MAG_MS6]